MENESTAVKPICTYCDKIITGAYFAFTENNLLVTSCISCNSNRTYSTTLKIENAIERVVADIDSLKRRLERLENKFNYYHHRH